MISRAHTVRIGGQQLKEGQVLCSGVTGCASTPQLREAWMVKAI